MINKLRANINGFNLQKQEGKIVIFFILSLLIYILFILYGDVKRIEQIAILFSWKIIPVLLLLTLLNYVIRALRFYIYLKETKITIDFVKSLWIFMAGLSMTVTPGKTGEIVKAYLLKKNTNVRIPEIIPILIIERVTDGIAMLILGIGGIFLLQSTLLFFLFSTLSVIFFIVLIKKQAIVLKLIAKLEKKYPRFKALEFFNTFFKNASQLLTLRPLIIGVTLGMIAWFMEGASLYILIQQFTQGNSFIDISKSLFIFSFSSITAFFVLLPGGVGVAEGSMTYLISRLYELSLPQSIFVTILFRFITLWFGVTLGLICLFSLLKKKITTNSIFPQSK